MTHSGQERIGIIVEWVTPDFEEIEAAAEVTAYAGHWS
jgi:coenzyme PQQ precursor peptide PqqA